MGSAGDLVARLYRGGRSLRARAAHADRWEGVRILGYHRIADVPGDVLSVSPRSFREQMESLRGFDARPLRLGEAIELLRRGPVRGRYVCVTFDDGYRDNLEEAEPVLRELGLPATIFVPTRVPGGEATYFWYRSPPSALSWQEIEELERDGLLDFQSHTRTHPWLPRLGEKRAREEIAASKEDLEARLGRPVTSLAYPGGLYGEREVRLVHEAGYAAGLTTDPGVNGGHGDRGALRRTLVFGDDGPSDFAAKLRGAFDRPSLGYRLVNRRRSLGDESTAYAPLDSRHA
jgi:peptidoglycan/xylan/chitin deacetylase (PgdA/CDA1 family)